MSEEIMAFCEANLSEYGGFFDVATNVLTVYGPNGEVDKTLLFEGA